MAYAGVIDDGKVRDVCRRAWELKLMNDVDLMERAMIRDIMNGGPKAVRALLGPKANPQNAPYANLMLTANDKLAQKLGRMPSTKKDAPLNDSEPARKRGEKELRIVGYMDDITKLPMLLPQNGRWLTGYGFTPWIVRHGYSRHGEPFPVLELRDPYNAFLGEWGATQQPTEIAFGRVIQPKTLADMYPEYREQLIGPGRGNAGAVILGAGDGNWSNQTGGGLLVFEYYDKDGCWWVVPERNLLLSYTPNLMKCTQFYVMKRFSFDRLTGQYDQIRGLMAGLARMSLLLLIATEDSVMAETNVYGDTAQGDKYKFGRNQVNWLTPGTKVEKPNSQVPFQAFQFLNTFEHQLRVGASYPVTDDGNSPMSFVTGRGINELAASTDLLVREYFTVISDGLRELDARRLEWDEVYYPDKTKTLRVAPGTPNAETYVPKAAIRGDYDTKRVYGAMAGFDEPSKIATGLQLLAAEIIDDETMMENVDGLEDLTRVKTRIRVKKDEKVLDELLLQMAGQGDKRVLQILVARMPDGDEKTMFQEVFLAPPDAEEQNEPAAPQMPQFQAPEDMRTAMSRVTAHGPGDARIALSTSTQQQQPVGA